MIVYQVINFDREEIIFGRTDIQLEKEVERLAKDSKGPAGHWKKGEVVQWRPLTELVTPERAAELHKDLERKSKPNKFKVLPTYKD